MKQGLEGQGGKIDTVIRDVTIGNGQSGYRLYRAVKHQTRRSVPRHCGRYSQSRQRLANVAAKMVRRLPHIC